ncbi:hypothetical protein [Sandaracinus amylolyticus]|uniref:hypothetical protein n=1 Tax=Sandaracinus amylolyticus TaxID=927083 RepID=UPI0012EDCC1A|nr:hypothetical protein [Sandaracinus amylolyticus]
MRSRVLVAITLLVAGCQRDAADDPPRISGPQRAAADVRRARMHERFESIDVARSALQRGDLEATRTIASTIAFRVPLDLPPPVRVHGDAVPRRALALSAAEDLDTAGIAFAQLVGTCGACHAAADATWTWPETPIPEGDDLEMQMQRHAWAHERMWEALLTRDPARFDRAASVLVGAPLGDDARVREIGERMRDAARDTERATTIDDRIAIYGRVVARCGACHARLRTLP